MTGTTYAIFTTTTTQEGTNTIETLKCLELEFSNQKNIIGLLNTYPMTDERGSKNTPYTFTLTNKCGTYVEYSIGLAINKDNTLEDKYVKTIFSLANDTGEPILLTDRVAGEVYNNKKTYIFRNDGLENNASKDYKLVLWVDESATKNQKGQSFIGNIIINTKPIKNEGQKTITADLDGGNLLQELNEIYREGMKIKLPIPAKAGYHFDRWEVTSGDATIDDNNYLTIGKENISLKAYYQGGLTLTLELNGGSTTQTINDFYGSGEKVTLIEPTKEGYKFGGWKITSGDGTLDGNTLTINTESVVIEATWKKQVTLTVDLNGGSTTQSFEDSYGEQDEINLTTPTKTNSTFAGWEITSGTAVIDNNKLTFGSNNVSIKALWQQTWNFDFTGSEQTLTAPHSGLYKLETWGAQGGNVTGGTNGGTVSGLVGGYGGYSTGLFYLEQGEILYINVGGQGPSNVTTSTNGTFVRKDGGYNGGGKAVVSDYYGFAGGGGGASHIATKSGLLSTLAENKEKIVLVAGGGGGSGYYNYDSAGIKGMGGGGGGINGTYSYRNNAVHTSPGTQTSGAAFGNGGFSSVTSGNGYHGGGGGGYYGGSAGSWGPGAGGSGYIGNSMLTDKVMYCYNCPSSTGTDTKTISTTCTNSSATENCAKQGNGYAKVQFLTAKATDNRVTLNKEFDSIKGEQTFVANVSGYYKLEVWGAQGGNVSGGTNGGTVTGVIGGYGGYATGTIYMKQNEILYVNVGSQGPSNVTTSKNGTFVSWSGGYNGGGKAVVSDFYGFVGGGGGASHIATKSGLLSALENSKSSIIIVAGGGGGAMYYNYNSAGSKGMGGTGGGISGSSGYLNTVGNSPTTGGSQTSGFKFGLGATTAVSSGNGYFPGGGGGYYGGYGGEWGPGGAGGSGFIGNTLLTNKAMYCYSCTESTAEATKTTSTTCTNSSATTNCAKQGNGYAKITFISEN